MIALVTGGTRGLGRGLTDGSAAGLAPELRPDRVTAGALETDELHDAGGRGDNNPPVITGGS